MVSKSLAGWTVTVSNMGLIRSTVWSNQATYTDAKIELAEITVARVLEHCPWGTIRGINTFNSHSNLWLSHCRYPISQMKQLRHSGLHILLKATRWVEEWRFKPRWSSVPTTAFNSFSEGTGPPNTHSSPSHLKSRACSCFFFPNLLQVLVICFLETESYIKKLLGRVYGAVPLSS